MRALLIGAPAAPADALPAVSDAFRRANWDVSAVPMAADAGEDAADLVLAPVGDVASQRGMRPSALVVAWLAAPDDPAAARALQAGADDVLWVDATVRVRVAVLVRAAERTARGLAASVDALRKANEDRVQLHDAASRRIVNIASATSEGIIVFADETIIYVNEVLARMVGWTVEEMEGQPFSKFTTLVERENATAAFGTGTFAPLVEVTHRDGTPLPLEVEFREGTWDARPVLIATLRDLRARRAREAEEMRREQEHRQQLEAQLRTIEESNARFELVARATNDILYDLDLTNGAVLWNNAIRTVLGYTGEIADANASWFQARIHPDDSRRVTSSRDRALRRGAESWSESYRFITPDGSAVDLMDRGIFVRNAEGKGIRMIGAMTDVTGHKQLQTRLVLADRLAGIGTMAAGVAHELNNPLTWVLANIRLVEETLGAQMPDPVARALDHAAQGAERMRAIVADLKVFSRNEPEAVSPVDVRATLHSALSIVGNDLRAVAELEHVDETIGPLYVLANEARLAQVLLNLLVNAVHAIAPGAPEQNRILVRVRTTHTDVILDIDDTGSGIPDALRSRIFEPFFTTKSAGTGTGLGLSIGLQLVKDMGGDLLLVPRAGRGTCFRVRLPTTTVHPPITRTRHSLPPSVPPHRRARVLVIDDEGLIVKMIDQVLASEFDVHGECVSTAALARIEAGERFDAVLCDMMMPVLNGIDIHRHVRAISPEQADRFIFVTGGVGTPRVGSFLAETRNPYVEKPFDLKTLRDAVRKMATR